jgi:hypothetical protein
MFTYLFPPPSLAQATPPRNRLRGRCAFAIHNSGTVSCLVAEENRNEAIKSTNNKRENTVAGLSYSGRNGQWSLPY